MTVRESKAGESRHVRMNDVVIETLQRLPRMINNPYVFYVCNANGRVKDLRWLWDKWMREADIQDFRWHDLRHTFASRLVMEGIDLYSVSKLLGHHDIKMTQRYAHLGPDYLQRAVDALAKRAQLTPELTPKTIGLSQ
jgi:integrase